jgi:hypothetical protein
MPMPAQQFLAWSFGAEEVEWTITAMEEHLVFWAIIFESDVARNYAERSTVDDQERFKDDPSGAWKSQYLYSAQQHIGGGPIAYFLASKPEHKRKACQIFKTL